LHAIRSAPVTSVQAFLTWSLEPLVGVDLWGTLRVPASRWRILGVTGDPGVQMLSSLPASFFEFDFASCPGDRRLGDSPARHPSAHDSDRAIFRFPFSIFRYAFHFRDL
jgi:hypothetical protein